MQYQLHSISGIIFENENKNNRTLRQTTHLAATSLVLSMKTSKLADALDIALNLLRLTYNTTVY